MSPPVSIPPLIPLPSNGKAPVDDPKDDIFATLFSPATPRSSPSTSPPSGGAVRPKPFPRHSRATSTDSDFGSFVSVPSQEDPLSQFVSSSDPDSVPFTPLQTFDFFEDAKSAQEKNKKGVLDELLNHEADPLYFLRSATPVGAQTGASALLPPNSPKPSDDLRSHPVAGTDSTPAAQPLVPIDPAPPSTSNRDMLDLLSMNVEDRRENASTHPHRSDTPLLPSNPPSRGDPAPRVPPARHVLDELLAHQDDPLYFHTPGSLTASPDTDDSRSATPQPISRSTSVSGEGLLVELDTPVEGGSGWHPRSQSESQVQSQHHSRSSSPSSPRRSPSLSPPPMRISKPEVQRTQSYFTPSSFTGGSTFPTRWVSSLLSRTAPPPPAQPVHAETEPAISTSLRAQGVAPITHGTPFAAHAYVPPSGAPGFAGDRAWNKGFEFDKENVERVSVRLLGRKESTTPVLSVELADKIRPHLPALRRLPRSWTLLYSLDQDGISLHTLYTRCEAHTGGALMIVRDSNDAMFGAWMGEGIKLSKGSYYGSGESFLWKISPERQLSVFKWSGKNDYVALCESEYISFGGGDGHYGLYLDDTLSDGSSAHCPTFENEPLCSPGPRQGGAITFECVGLEVWGVG